jgi:hypothetical protein
MMFQPQHLLAEKELWRLHLVASKQETLACGPLYINQHFPKVILVG